MEALPFLEGTLFLVPLRRGGFARGLVARSAPEGALLFGYFFGPKVSSLVQMNTDDMRPEFAIARLLFSDLGLVNGEWPIVGVVPNWRREDWAMPDFVRRDVIGRRAWLVRRSDADPSKIDEELPIVFDSSHPENIASGYGSVELKLTKILG